MHLMWRWCTLTLTDNERNAIWCFLVKIIQCYDFARTWIETSIFNEAWKVWEDQQFCLFLGVGWHMLSISSQLVLGTRRPIANSMHLFVGCGCPVSPQPGVWQMQLWLRVLDFKKAFDLKCACSNCPPRAFGGQLTLVCRSRLATCFNCPPRPFGKQLALVCTKLCWFCRIMCWQCVWQ